MSAAGPDNRADDRTLAIRPRTVVTVLALILAFGLAIAFVLNAWRPISWVAVAAFLAMALNPPVAALERRGVPRAPAAGAVFASALALFGGLGWLILPPLLAQAQAFLDAIPALLANLTAGRGPLGFLERDYGIVARVTEALQRRELSETAVSLASTIAGTFLALLTITFLTFFLMLEGRTWVERILGLIPAGSRERWRRGSEDVYRMAVGFAVGNVLISGIAGAVVFTALSLASVPYALPLAVLVALLDLVPLAGALIAGAIVTGVAFTISPATGIGILIVVFAYQQLENHLLQPLIYGRTVKLSPLVVLVSVLIGIELAGILGALAAIPVAAAAQIVIIEFLALRRERACPETD